MRKSDHKMAIHVGQIDEERARRGLDLIENGPVLLLKRIRAEAAKPGEE